MANNSKPENLITLSESVVMSAANTYTEVEIDTVIGPFDNIIYELREVEWELTDMDGATEGDYEYLSVHRDEQTGMPNITEKTVISQHLERFNVAVSGGARSNDLPHKTWKKGEGPLIANNPIYFGMITAGQAGAKSGRVKLRLKPLNVTDAQFIKLAKLFAK